MENDAPKIPVEESLKDYIRRRAIIDQERIKEADRAFYRGPFFIFAAPLFLGLVCSLAHCIYMGDEEEGKMNLSNELIRKYDINQDGRLDASEIKNLQRDYRIEKR